jgi:hypothetical protein
MRGKAGPLFDVRRIWLAMIPILAYAEIHPRWRFVPNRMRNGLPEILADAPRRIRRGRPLPFLLIVKDSCLYPMELSSARVVIIQAGKAVRDLELLTEPVRLDQHLWFRLARPVFGRAAWPGAMRSGLGRVRRPETRQ